MIGLSDLGETYTEYSIASTGDLIKFWSSNVEGQRSQFRLVGEGIHVDAGVSKSI